MNTRLFLFVCICLSCFSTRLFAQFGLPQADISDHRPNEFAIVNATIIPEPGKRIDSATLYVKNGKIIALGKQVALPARVPRYSAAGLWVYPAFIDLYSTYGIVSPATTANPMERMGRPIYESQKPGNYLWNQALKPEYDALSQFSPQPKEAAALRKLGFGYVVSGSKDGILRGSSYLAALGEGKASELIKSGMVASGLSFQKGSSRQEYPSSQMGAIALLRQTFLDLDFYKKSKPKEKSQAFESLNRQLEKPILADVGQKYEVLRVASLAKEFDLKLIIKGKGDEYQRASEIKKAGFPLLLSLNYPEMPDVEDPLDAAMVSVADLKHWELAPYNAALLSKAGVPFAFTSADLKDPQRFWPNLKKAIQCGLNEDEALAALTTRPAAFMGMSAEIGRLAPGMLASFNLASGNIFSSSASLIETWIEGKKYSNSPNVWAENRGKFRFILGLDSNRILQISLKDGKSEFLVFEGDTVGKKLNGKLQNGQLMLSGKLKKLDSTLIFQGTGWLVGKDFQGWYSLGSKGKFPWYARWIEPEKMVAAKDTQKKKAPEIPQLWYPFQAYGSNTLPTAKDYLIKGATVWTNTGAGKLDKADVWISGGKIKKVGANLVVPGAEVIQAEGKHLSPGIIDEHSHIAISKGVNEGSSTTSSEVRVGDVIEADDVNIYRHLAGGVTAVQQLHGSANTIGGQSSLIKLRWGKTPQEMKIEGTDGFIKFALGENVKQSNWGDFNTTRYPQTRMGVEQLLYDAFHQAKRYQEDRNAALKSKQAFRRDLKLEALAEILEKKRFITCHSYVQSEINMLMHVADSMGFKVNTFTHILEGYKVADKMARHPAGASTFSDWWAYKMEVKDAIPYNAALLHRAGVTVAINSDDAEMARRLNQEAAKTIKFGGVSEEEALKMVTLNPAKLLHLDQRMGSVAEGKDADLVIWSGPPLSMYAKAEKTFIDGCLYFDVDRDKQLLNNQQAEKQRIIQKILAEKQSGTPTVPIAPKRQRLWHCDDEGEEE